MPDLFKSLVWENLVKAGIQRLFLAVPVLGWGPIGWIVSAVIFKFADMFYEAVKLQINLQLIVFNNAKFLAEYVDASLKLKEIAGRTGIESDEFKQARGSHAEALSKFVRLGA